MAPEKADEVKEKKVRVQQRFESLKTPLLDRQLKLTKKKSALQFRRDIEDEKLWIAEKLPQANSPEFGDSLVSVHMLTRRNQSLQNEISNHEPRINAVSGGTPRRRAVLAGGSGRTAADALSSSWTMQLQSSLKPQELRLGFEEDCGCSCKHVQLLGFLGLLQ